MPKDKKIGVLGEAEGVKALRELVKREKDLECPLEDEFLLRFIRAKKFNVDAAFKSVQSYYKLRENFPDLISFPSAVRNQFDGKMYNILPNKDMKGPRVVLFKTRNCNLDEFNLNDIFMSGYLMAEEVTSHEDGQLNGILMIFDHGGITFTQMRKIAGQFSIKQIKQILAFYNGYPARFKGVHVVNHPRIFDMVFMLSRPFMSEKLSKRIHEHGTNIKKLQNFFSVDILPESLGGNVPDDECTDSEYMKRFFGKDEYYKDMAKYGYKKKQ